MLIRSLKTQSVLLLLILAVYIFAGWNEFVASLTGFGISAALILSSSAILEKIEGRDDRLFVQVFFFAMAVRFTLAVILVGILLEVTKIDEIYFTVSFIISYLYQSVTETIFIQKILHQRSTEK
jgi:hypothetical protein